VTAVTLPQRRRTVAIVRPPGDSFVRAESRHPERDRIDPERARAQHAAYCRLLEAAGVEVVELGPDEAHPDVVQPPGTLEGGDLLRVGRRIIVGRSRRTNDAGVEALRCFAEPLGWEVCTAEVPSWALHLQTAATGVGDRIVLGPQEVVTQPAFDGLDRVVVPDDDRGAGNVLVIDRAGQGERSFVIAAGSHPVHRELEARGFEVHATALDEFERADGSPTCLSLIVEPIPSVPAPRGTV
jgi:dimethylargininase